MFQGLWSELKLSVDAVLENAKGYTYMYVAGKTDRGSEFQFLWGSSHRDKRGGECDLL